MAESTYRQRREARAEKLREWADKRSAKGSALYDRAHEMAEVIPLGQPILIGHHSEKRDRNYRERISRTYDRAFQNMNKAGEMTSRAGEIEYQLDRSIYDDDPDALDRLREKLAELESQREQRTTANAAYRKEHRAELAAMTPYQRSQAVPWPSYSLSNLSGNIKRTRDRIARLEREQAPEYQEAPRYLYSVKYAGKCRECGRTIERGESALYYRQAKEMACRDHEATS